MLQAPRSCVSSPLLCAVPLRDGRVWNLAGMGVSVVCAYPCRYCGPAWFVIAACPLQVLRSCFSSATPLAGTAVLRLSLAFRPSLHVPSEPAANGKHAARPPSGPGWHSSIVFTTGGGRVGLGFGGCWLGLHSCAAACGLRRRTGIDRQHRRRDPSPYCRLGRRRKGTSRCSRSGSSGLVVVLELHAPGRGGCSV